MKYSTVTGLTWSKEKDSILCWVDFESVGNVPFGASPNDPLAHGKEIYARCIAGDFGPIAEYVPAPDEGPQKITLAPNQPVANGVQTI
jgi:hypothetical protein